MTRLPQPRGPRSEALAAALGRPPHPLRLPVAPTAANPLADDDLHLAMYVCYELAYRGFDDVDDRWEWEPDLIAFRGALERLFEEGLRDVLGPPAPPPARVQDALRLVVADDAGPSLSRHIERRASAVEVREFCVHRSAYHLKEADPHTWAIPRIAGPAKAAMVEIQADEYGGGRAERMHAKLFSDVLEALGLDTGYGAYLDRVPGVTLATVNLMSLFGLHRRLRGAACGHLTAFEMTSTEPNRRYAKGLRRLGFDDPRATEFFDEHVEADAAHEALALHDVAGALAAAEPEVAGHIVWGARALMLLDARFAEHLLDAWAAGRTSLRHPLPDSAPPFAA
jgi:hypothetical protein